MTLSCRSSRTQYSSVGKTCFHVFSHHTWWSSCPLSAALSSRGFRLSWQLTICRTSFINCKHANTHINFQPNTSAISLFGWVFRWDHRLRPKLIWRTIFGLSPELRLMNFTECKLTNPFIGQRLTPAAYIPVFVYFWISEKVNLFSTSKTTSNLNFACKINQWVQINLHSPEANHWHQSLE